MYPPVSLPVLWLHAAGWEQHRPICASGAGHAGRLLLTSPGCLVMREHHRPGTPAMGGPAAIHTPTPDAAVPLPLICGYYDGVILVSDAALFVVPTRLLAPPK